MSSNIHVRMKNINLLIYRILVPQRVALVATNCSFFNSNFIADEVESRVAICKILSNDSHAHGYLGTAKSLGSPQNVTVEWLMVDGKLY